MKKKIAIILSVVVVALASAFVIGGMLFKKIPYDAKLYSERKEMDGWVRTEFLNENKVYGAHYVNPEWTEESNDISEYYQDRESPETRTFLIKDEAMFKDIFYEDALDVNFEEEMVVLHIFTAGNPRGYDLKDVKVQGGKVMIEMKLQEARRGVADHIQPYQRYVVIKMKKLDVSEVEVKHL